jgi:hypothetical protein
VLIALALTLTGCETSAEKSAKLEKLAKVQELQIRRRRELAQSALSIARPSTRVRVLATAVLHSSEGAAAIVTLRNLSSTPQRGVPIQITVKNAGGASIYANDVPGLAVSLLRVPLLPAHGSTTWVDDQIPAAGNPASVTAKVGEGTPAPGTVPRLSVAGAHLTGESSSGAEVEGEVVNHSATAQQDVIVYALARRGARIVAAGRSVLAQVPGSGASTHFQVYFIGDPTGGRLELNAVAATSG